MMGRRARAGAIAGARGLYHIVCFARSGQARS